MRIAGPHSAGSHSGRAGAAAEPEAGPDPDDGTEDPPGGDGCRPHAATTQAIHAILTSWAMPQPSLRRGRGSYWPLYSSISSAPLVKPPQVALYFSA
jgi:hypothetical protein